MKVVLAVALLASPASAIIVAGANGGPGNANNTTGAQLDAALGQAFPFYHNVIRYSDSSGIYLGYDSGTNDIWVLSAKHVTATTAGSSLTIQGQTYIQQGAQIGISQSDLKLIRYHHETTDLVPSLAAVPLASTAPTISTEVVMIGWGLQREEAAATGPTDNDSITVAEGNGMGYTWGDGGRFLRWGTNHVDTAPQVYENPSDMDAIQDNVYWFSDFDMPGTSEWTSSNEGSLTLYDSGSGAFFEDGGEWLLGGVAWSVSTIGTSAFTDPSDEQGSFYTDVASFASDLNDEIGVVLVPEPGVTWLLLLGGILVGRRRR